MADQEVLAALAGHAFLAGMAPEHLQALADCGRRVSVSRDELLGQEREPANAFYLIQAGRVGIEMRTPDRGAVRVQTIGPGDVVGWSWLVPPHRWQFDARVLEPVQAVLLDARQLRDRCEQDPALGYQLLKRLLAVVAGRTAATRRQLLDAVR
jgi:CRP-like cAMP-binding protein